MSDDPSLSFAAPTLAWRLEACSADELDALDYGVIGFDADGRVQRYNACESRLAGLAPARVLGRLLFTQVAPCLNNERVAQRFADADRAGTLLDHTLDHVLTLRMRPLTVQLRLLAAPTLHWRHVLVRRPA